MLRNFDRKTMVAALDDALASASVESYLNAAVGGGRDLTLTAVSGEHLRIIQGPDGPVVALVDGEAVVDHRPTGQFMFANGKCLVAENGRVIGGDDFTTYRRWALFALLPEH